MADETDTAAPAPVQFRSCSKCGEAKPVTAFGYNRSVAGEKALRAHCRACYNVGRRAHYARAGVHAEKQAKRRAYEARPDVVEARKSLRRRPDIRAKEKASRDAYRAKAEVRARHAEYRRAYMSLPETRALALFGAVRLRAQKRGLPFDLTLDWVRERVLAGRCSLTGIDFDCEPPPSGWRYNPRGPSVDQITAGAGYTMANCRVVITALNNALSQYGDEFFEGMAAAFLKQRGYQITASAGELPRP